MPPFYFIGISISIAYFFQKTHKIKPERSVWIGCDFLGKEKGKKEKREKKENHSRLTRERQTGGTALCLLRGMGIAFAITCIIFIGFGMILTYTAASEESLPLVSLICTALSVAAAGYDWAACKRKRGLLWGALAGLVYTALLYVITSLAADSFVLHASGLMTLAVALAAGVIGGILGVNRR